jgi:NADH:ubiquinone oxidoreductase subunit 4 (subunit M)
MTGSLLMLAGILRGAAVRRLDDADVSRTDSLTARCGCSRLLVWGFAIKVPLWPLHSWLPMPIPKLLRQLSYPGRFVAEMGAYGF